MTSTVLAAALTYCEIELADNRLFEAILTDVRGAVLLVPTLIRFSTSASVHHQSGSLVVTSWEDLSESSSSYSTSSSTSPVDEFESFADGDVAIDDEHESDEFDEQHGIDGVEREQFVVIGRNR